MLFLDLLLRLIVIIPFSSATHPFDQLRAQNFYPLTTYENSETFESPLHVMVPSNLQPDIQNDRGLVSLAGSHTDWAIISCSQKRLPIPDCEAAMNIIPTGHLALDPKDAHSLGTVESNESVRWNAPLPRPLRKFRLPAAFRAGKCAVFVRHYRGVEMDLFSLPPPGAPAGFSAAAFMYHTVWPNSRRLADLIIKRCGGREGLTPTASSPESNKALFKIFRYLVKVESPRAETLAMYNVYE
jgi:hypothetical protein